jgi:hypothetical protein
MDAADHQFLPVFWLTPLFLPAGNKASDEKSPDSGDCGSKYPFCLLRGHILDLLIT